MNINILSEITQTVKDEFGSLSEEILNKKTSNKEWSIGQCLEHIINTNQAYLPILISVRDGKHRPSFWEKNNMLTNYTGRRMISTLGPQIQKKYIAPRIFAPSKSIIKGDIIKRFSANQERMTELFKILEQKKFNEIVITSPVASLITLKLRDVISIIIVHEQRHLQQALAIKKKIEQL
jgi:hypothetical protein